MCKLILFFISSSLLLALTPRAVNAFPFFYRCDNGQTVVHRPEYKSAKGTMVSIYPFPVEERSQVLWRFPARYAEGRHSARYFISDNGQEYDCKQWRHGDDGHGPAWGIPDPAALRKYAKRFNRDGKYRYYCEEGHTVLFRITDFQDTFNYLHGVMEVDHKEEVGLYHTRGNSGHFNSKSSGDPGISFAWGLHPDENERYVLKHFLIIDDDVFICKREKKLSL